MIQVRFGLASVKLLTPVFGSGWDRRPGCKASNCKNLSSVFTLLVLENVFMETFLRTVGVEYVLRDFDIFSGAQWIV